MDLEYFLFIDSGIGGLSTLAHATKIINSNYIYYADNKNCPYGSHISQEIYDFVEKIVLQITEKRKVKAIILACNTATTSAIEKLRKNFPSFIFIGTEPAVYLAQKKGYKKIFALTTPTTAKQDKYKLLVKKCIESEITTFCHKNLASDIEKFLCNETYISYYTLLRDIFQVINNLNKKKYDCIVLGCTHYCFVKDLISKFTSLPLIDGNAGVCKKIASLSPQNNPATSHIIYEFSCKNKLLMQKYKKCYNKYLQKI